MPLDPILRSPSKLYYTDPNTLAEAVVAQPTANNELSIYNKIDVITSVTTPSIYLNGLQGKLEFNTANNTLKLDGNEIALTSYVDTGISNEYTRFAAYNNINAGQTVALRDDGLITSQIGLSTVVVNDISHIDSSTDIGGSSNFAHQIGYDTNSNKFLFTYIENGIAAKVGELVNNELVLTNPSIFDTATTPSFRNIPFIPSLNKFLITYVDGKILRYVLAEIQNDNSITFSTPIDAHDNTSVGFIRYFTTHVDISTNKIITIFSDDTQAYSFVSDIDSNSNITLGTASNNLHTGIARWFSIAKEPTLNKYAVAYKEGTLDDASIKIGTVSGNTMSFGTSTAIPQFARRISNDLSAKPVVHYVNSLGKMAIVYSAGAIFKLVLAQVYANNNVTLNSPIDIDDPDPNTIGIDYLDADYSSYLNKEVLVYRRNDGTIGADGTYAIIDFANTTPDIIYEDTKFAGAGLFTNPTVAIVPNSTTIASVYVPGSGSVGSGKIVISEFNSELTESPNNFIGIAKTNITSGTEGPVYMVGDVANNQTGLITNQIYYLEANGSLTTSETSYGLVGKALSNTSIKLLEPIVNDYKNLINKPDEQFASLEDAAFINSIIFG